MEVLNVNWMSIPKCDHNHILQVLPVGGYIRSLPSGTPSTSIHIRIPVLGRLKTNCIYDPSDPSVCETEVLSFHRITAYNPEGEKEYIWREEDCWSEKISDCGDGLGFISKGEKCGNREASRTIRKRGKTTPEIGL